MLPKHLKLTGKEINYMLKRWRRIYGKLCTFWVIPQYPQKSYNQRAFQIPTKIDKRASMRNLIKRAWFEYIAWSHNVSTIQCSSQVSTQSLQNMYYKYFVVVNKKQSHQLQHIIATWSKTDIVSYRTTLLDKDIHLVQRSLLNRRSSQVSRHTADHHTRPHKSKHTRSHTKQKSACRPQYQR